MAGGAYRLWQATEDQLDGSWPTAYYIFVPGISVEYLVVAGGGSGGAYGGGGGRCATMNSC